jgi:hypothetical protein
VNRRSTENLDIIRIVGQFNVPEFRRITPNDTGYPVDILRYANYLLLFHGCRIAEIEIRNITAASGFFTFLPAFCQKKMQSPRVTDT